MQFDPGNKVIQFGAHRMEMETKQKHDEAKAFFYRHGTKQQMILKSLLQPIALPGIKDQYEKS
jgi:hypothetical protein